MGSTMFISAVLAALLSNNGLGPIGSLLVGIAIGAAIGCINGYFVAKLKIPGLIVTLATLYIIRGIGLTIGGNGVLYFTERVSNALVFSRLFNAVPAVIIVLAITMIIAQLILSQTLFGRQLYAIGNNKTAAQIMGIKVTRNIFLAYVICGALAGLAGIVSGVQVGGVAQTFATGMEFIIISATVLGGVSLFGGKGGAFPAAFIGVLIVMCIQNGLVMAKTNAYFYTIIGGIVIYVAVMLDSMRNKSALR
jgi:ribose transport system permease protein